jgi:TolB-like protein/DNA-binding winged helix-turn-helix (wHTH) protein/Tfp pilus assembly protein PilF
MRRFKFGPFELDPEARALRRDGEPIPTAGKALDMLLVLVENRGRLVDKDELLSRVWAGAVVDEANLTQTIFTVRKILGDSPKDHRYIATVPGRGYQFVAATTEIASQNVTRQPLADVEDFPRPRNMWVRVAMAAVGLLVLFAVSYLVWRLTFGHGAGGQLQIGSVAVLPLTNLAGEGTEDYLADGMTEELITELARIGSFRVISRTSVMRYKKTGRSLSEIARELNVDALVEGAVRRSGDSVRITVQLVGTSPERHIWADAYEGDIRDVLRLERDVADDIGSKIRTKLAGRESAVPRPRKRLDPETYEDYLRGRYFLARRSAESMNKAVEYFRQAIQRDAQYVEAYVGLAEAYDLLGMYELLPPSVSFPKAKEFASRALQLDGTLSGAYTAVATAESFWDRDWAAADRDFQRAITLDPSSAIAYHWYGEHLVTIGKAERAIAELKRAHELDPLSIPVNIALGRTYRDAHRYDEAVQQCKKTIEVDPNLAMGHRCLGQAYVGQRRYSEAIPELELASAAGPTPLLISELGYAYASAGKAAKAKAMLQTLMSKAQSAYVPAYLIAEIHAGLGEKDEAFRWLERAYRERDAQIGYLALDPEMDPLRSDPRFPPLIRRLNLPQ